jgi:hypothetical protein
VLPSLLRRVLCVGGGWGLLLLLLVIPVSFLLLRSRRLAETPIVLADLHAIPDLRAVLRTARPRSVAALWFDAFLIALDLCSSIFDCFWGVCPCPGIRMGFVLRSTVIIANIVMTVSIIDVTTGSHVVYVAACLTACCMQLAPISDVIDVNVNALSDEALTGASFVERSRL